MMHGIEASISMTVLNVTANFLGAILAIKSAVNTPIGKDSIKDKNAMNKVEMIKNPTAYKFELKASPMSQVVPVKKSCKWTLPRPPLFVIKGVTPLTKMTPAMMNMNEDDSIAKLIKIYLMALSIH
jgi:hypothetical protein